MELSEYKNIYKNERSHFFYASTHYLVEKLARKYLGKWRGLKMLDAGCGTGGLMKRLSKVGDMVGIDFSLEAIKLAKRRGVSAKPGTVERMPFKDNQFDLVTCIDVIYHKQVKDDVKALKEIGRVLKPGGFLILRVPANKFLMSAHDVHVHTARRYDRKELVMKLRKGGLKTMFISYVHSPIFPISALRVAVEKLIKTTNKSSVGCVNPFVNTLFTLVLKLEAWLIAMGMVVPFGQGLIAVASK